jgi:hypothetical protein
MSTPTKDELDKAAAVITRRKQHGCITHLKAAGCSDAKITELLPKYAALDASRTKNNQELISAITGK